MKATTALMLAVAAAAAGCATTGDPLQGGLFGWSEEQAQARQASLRQTDAAAQQEASAENARTAALRGQRSDLTAEAARLRSELDRLLAESSKLDAQLRELMRRRQLGGDEAARLRKLLADNERVRQAARGAASGGASASAQPRVEAMHDQNGRMHREVLILLQR
jgi:predicted RNase H-like nuclease (RuvC/YqgF family)